MNVCHLLGRVSTEPLLETTRGGRKICRFQLSTSNGRGRPPTKHNIIIWGKNPRDEHPDKVYKYVHLGDKVQVTGKITENRWQSRDSSTWRVKTEIVASGIEFLSQPSVNVSTENNEEEPDAISE